MTLYQQGDVVRIKDWADLMLLGENTEGNDIWLKKDGIYFSHEMELFCGRVFKIARAGKGIRSGLSARDEYMFEITDDIKLNADLNQWTWTNEMLELFFREPVFSLKEFSKEELLTLLDTFG